MITPLVIYSIFITIAFLSNLHFNKKFTDQVIKLYNNAFMNYKERYDYCQILQDVISLKINSNEEFYIKIEEHKRKHIDLYSNMDQEIKDALK